MPADGMSHTPRLSVGDNVEYNSPTNQRWLGDSVVTVVNGDGTYQVDVTKIVRKVENKPSVWGGEAPGNIRIAYTPAIGDDVEYHSPTNQRWLDGSVISAINDDGTFQIDVWKNTREGIIIENKPAVVFGEAPGTIRKPHVLAVGDAVEYHSPTNERWLDRCTVTALNDDGSVAIDVVKRVRRVETKHAVVLGTAPGTIRPAAPTFEVGDHVDYFSPTNQRWLDGCVVRSVNADGTYQIDVWKATEDGIIVETKPSVRFGDAPTNIRPHIPSAVPEPQVIEELEKMRLEAESEAAQLRAQFETVTSESEAEIAALREELYRLRQESENVRQAKIQMETAARNAPATTDSSMSTIQDSAIGGDMHVGATHNVTTVTNDAEAIARAAVEAYRMAMADRS